VSATEPYRPSNGTAGEIFRQDWCERCQNPDCHPDIAPGCCPSAHRVADRSPKPATAQCEPRVAFVDGIGGTAQQMRQADLSHRAVAQLSTIAVGHPPIYLCPFSNVSDAALRTDTLHAADLYAA
jgi:hypothetical protein